MFLYKTIFFILLDIRSISAGGPEKPFKCSKCGRAYSQKCTMKKHLKHLIQNHEIDPSQLAVLGAGKIISYTLLLKKVKIDLYIT